MRTVLGVGLALVLWSGCVNQTGSRVVVGVGLTFAALSAASYAAASRPNDEFGAALGVISGGIITVSGLLGMAVHTLIDDQSTSDEAAERTERLPRRHRLLSRDEMAACNQARGTERIAAQRIPGARERGQALQRIKPCETTTDEPAPDPMAREDAWAVTKHAARAARSGDCAAVAADSKLVRDLDVEFHATVFMRDAAIERCLQP